jgi:predicted DNA-binding transcriptional regulator AlpA
MPKLKPGLPAGVRNFDELPDTALVRVNVVSSVEGVNPSTIWRWVKAGTFPAPEKTGPNTTSWRVGAIRRRRMSA